MSGRANGAEAAVPRRRKSEAQRAKEEAARVRLLRAAGEVVGEGGFEKATVAAITARAEVAHGAFYLHFKSRQDIFDQLLSSMGGELMAFISAAIRDSSDLLEIERRGLEANIAFSHSHPFMHRVMAEAELFAPVTYRTFMAELRARYVRSLRRSKRAGGLPGFRENELDALAVLLMGMRRALIHAYCLDADAPGALPREVVAAYLKLIAGAIARRDGVRLPGAARPRKPAQKPARKPGQKQGQKTDR